MSSMPCKPLKIFLLPLFFLFATFGSFLSANEGVLKLKRLIESNLHDTTKCRIIYEMIESEVSDEVWPKFNPILKNVAIKNLNSKITAEERKIYTRYLAEAINNEGLLNFRRGKILEALSDYSQCLQLWRKINNEAGIITANYSMAQVYTALGENSKGVHLFKLVISAYNGRNEKLKLYAYNELAAHYKKNGKPDSSIYYLEKTDIVNRFVKDYYVSVVTKMQLGSLYREKANYKLARKLFKEGYELIKNKNYTDGRALYFIGMTKVSMDEKKYDEAEKYALEGYKIVSKVGYTDYLKEISKLLISIYEYKGQDLKAFKMYKLFNQLKNSSSEIESKKELFKRELQFDYQKKLVADSLKTIEEKKLIALELKQEKRQKYTLYFGLALVIVFSVIMVRRFRVAFQQMKIIKIKSKETEVQKLLVEEKQKEIMDSISYARRLQEAILPPLEMIENYFSDNFVLYKPKDIVAGDFYWAERVGDLFFIAAADSTGHGVPGAMVSVVCSNALNRSLKEFNLIEPGKILDKTRDLILETFEKSAKDVNDGMDISLLCINKVQRKIYWSGANNRVWFINGDKLNEIKADKQSVGKTFNPKPFKTHEIEFADDTTFYLFTDGFADQFGGDKGKKFRYKKMAEMFLKTNKQLMSYQKEQINKTFEQWKGQLEQVDDVCVIGLKI